MNKNKLKYLLTPITFVILSACGGGSESPVTPNTSAPAPTPINKAPSHDGNLSFTLKESDDILVINLLSGSTDPENDTLTITNLTANSNNPSKGITASESNITILPSLFINELFEGQSQTISYTYNISDGKLTVDRTVTIVINGEGQVAVTPNNSAIIIDLNTQQFYGHVTQLDRTKFFNMHDTFTTNEYKLSTIENYKNNFRIGHGRQFWSPLSQSVVKSQLDSSGTYPTTSVAVSNGKSSILGYYNNDKSSITSNRIVVTDHPRNVIYNNNDPLDGARWAADYFTHYFDDNSRPLFYEPMNEPFVHAGEFKANYNNSEEQVREHMTQWFAEIGKEFDTRPELSKVNVIGFASAWPSLELFNFGHWESRMKMFMDNAGDHMDAFSTHLYDGVNIVGANSSRSGSNSQAILDLIETYSMIKWDVVKPHAITEYGAIVDRPAGVVEYDEAVNSQTIKSFNHIMLELMEREDRILTSIPFLTGYASWYWKDPSQGNGHPYNPSMWRPNPDNITLNTTTNKWQFINENAANNYLLNNNSLFLEFWKEIEGYRANITNNDPDTQVAVYVNDDKAYIILSNLERDEKDVQMNIAEMIGYKFTNITIERLTVPANSGATLTSTSHDLTATVSGNEFTLGALTLAPSETVKFVVTLDKNIESASTAQRSSYYSDDHLKTIVANQDISFNFSGLDVTSLDPEKSTASIRMAIGRAHDKSKQPTITVNGTVIPVPNDWAGYDQANRDLFFGAIDIPVAHQLLTTNTEVVVNFPDASGHVSSVIIEVNNYINPINASSIDIGDNITLNVAESKQVSTEIAPFGIAKSRVTWTTDNTAVATVNDSGLITAIGSGIANITATTKNGVSDSIKVTIENLDPNLITGNESTFNDEIDTNKLFARSESEQLNLATFSVESSAAKDGASGLLVDTSNGGLKLQYAGITGVDQTKAYTISFDAKIISGKATLWINTALLGWKNVNFDNTTNEWQTVSYEIPAGKLGTGTFPVNFHIDNLDSPGTLYIDNITLAHKG